MLTTPASTIHRPPHPLAPTVHAEWTKLRSSRATTVALAVATIGAVALGGLTLAGRRSEWTTMTARARAEFDPTSTSLVGIILAALVIGALGVRAMANEHTTGLIRLTYTAMPRRELVLLAKVALLVTIGTVVGAIANTIAVAFGAWILEPTGVAVGLGATGVARAIAFGSIGVGLIVAMGVALGALLRRAAPANILLALIVIGGQLLGAALPGDTARYLPSATLEALVTTNPSGDTMTPAVALAVITLETAALVGLALRSVARRDP